MVKEHLKSLRDFILKYNTYFTAGYDDVFADVKTGNIMNRETPVFPNDTLGNYFYLRLPQNMGFDYDTKLFTLAEGVNGVGIKVPVTLVAVLTDGDADQLLSNLIITVRQYQPDFVKFKQCTYQSDVVIAQELKTLKKEDMEAALQKAGGFTIVSLAFELSFLSQFLELNCIKKPC